MKIVRILALVLGAYVVLGLGLDAAIGYFQPRAESTAVLRTYGADGEPMDRVLSLHEDEGQLWVESGHWFRGWYRRAQANPEVELIRDGDPEPFTAVAVQTPVAVERMTRLMGKGDGAGYYVGRTMLLWAPIKPVRLDPRPVAP